MEQARRSEGGTPGYYKHFVTILERNTVSSSAFVLTDAVLAELKRQAQDGCVLCSLDSLGEEEWD